MRRLALAGVLALLLAPSAHAGINSAYKVSGDAQARPIQAFDDGQWLYVQMRDPSSPPAPIGPQGPVAYQMRGPYLVLPMMPVVTLRYGPYQARVSSSGSGDAMPGVVSVTRPVEVMPSSSVPMPSARPTGSLPVAPTSVASTLGDGAVSGEIVVAGPRSTSTSFGAVSKSIATAMAESATSFTGLAGKKVVLSADGTSAGAIAVIAAEKTCESAGATCSINYKGARPGEIMIAEKSE